MDRVARVLEGAIDLHCHTSPSLFVRALDHVEATRQAADAGMRAIVVKDHHHPTANEVDLARKYGLAGISTQLFGSIALNNYVGGVNPFAVDFALKQGCKIVWMPTLSSENHIRHHQADPNLLFPKYHEEPLAEIPLRILNAQGELKMEVRQVLRLIAEAGAVLATGHLSVEEIDVLLDEAGRLGVGKVVITHPKFVVDATDEDLVRFANQGAYIEHTIGMFWPDSIFYFYDVPEVLRLIDLVGADRTVIVSDLGQKENPTPVAGFRWAIEQFLEHGASEDLISLSMKVNPAHLLGLD